MIGNRLPSVPVPAPAVRGHVGEPAGAAVTDDLGAARKRHEERRRAPGLRNWLVGVAAAAVIALGGVGVGAYVANQDDPLNQVLRAQDVRQATVDVSGGGTVTVSISSSKDAVVVKMNGVPVPPAGKVYQMWLIPKDGSAPVSQGLMDAEALSKPAVVAFVQQQRWASRLSPRAALLRPPCRQWPPHRSERNRPGPDVRRRSAVYH
jgi:hypothetical protein